MTSHNPEQRQAQEPARIWVLILIVIIGLGIVALLMVTSQREKLNSKESANVAAHNEPAPESSAVTDVAPVSLSMAPGFVRIPSKSGSEPPVNARELVKSLSEINLQPGELTPEKAEQWHRNILELIGQGTAAVPALQEFFQRNVDVRFDSGPGTNLLREPSLRIAFLKVLFDLPTPDNVELQKKVLRTTTNPDEIALLARQLQAQEPWKYRELIVETAQAAMERARSGQSAGRDTRTLAKVLEYYGVLVEK